MHIYDKMETDRNKPIGFYDSGVGGITVLDTALSLLPRENYIYLADCAYAPYGSRTRAEIIARAQYCVKSLLQEGAKAIVIACNTATATAIEILRSQFDCIIVGAEPAVKPACESSRNKNILVLTTPLTAVQPRLRKLIEEFPDKNITVAPTDGLAAAVERHIADLDRVRPMIDCILSSYPRPDAVVLGCTHYVHLKTFVTAFYGGKVPVYDGNTGIINHLRQQLESRNLLGVSGGFVRFYTTGASS